MLVKIYVISKHSQKRDEEEIAREMCQSQGVIILDSAYTGEAGFSKEIAREIRIAMIRGIPIYYRPDLKTIQDWLDEVSFNQKEREKTIVVKNEIQF